jgi:hypothetical protein
VDFEHIGVALGFTVVEVFGEVAFGKDLLRVQHEVAQQSEFSGSELNVGAVAGYALATFIQVQPGGLERRLVGLAALPGERVWSGNRRRQP